MHREHDKSLFVQEATLYRDMRNLYKMGRDHLGELDVLLNHLEYTNLRKSCINCDT
jgi:hypothetical protein